MDLPGNIKPKISEFSDTGQIWFWKSNPIEIPQYFGPVGHSDNVFIAYIYRAIPFTGEWYRIFFWLVTVSFSKIIQLSEAYVAPNGSRGTNTCRENNYDVTKLYNQW